MALDVRGGAPTSNGQWAEVYTDNNGPAQQWAFFSNGDGSYRMMSRVDNQAKCISVYGGSTASPANLHMWDYTTAAEQGWILEKASDVVFDKICLIYNYAKQYKPNGTDRQHQELTLQFIRRNVYNSALWNITAGSVDNNFISYVNSKNSALLTAFDGTNNSIGRNIYDKSGNKIDFYHLIGTLNGLIHLNDGIIGTTGKNLAGWAGDLQSLVPEVLEALEKEGKDETYNNIYNKTYALLFTGTSKNFGHEDLYADTDAYNIYVCLNNMIMESFEDYFEYYYDYPYTQRFTLFTNSWSKEEISNVVEKYLSNALVLGDFKWLSTTQKNAFRDSFTDYIWLRASHE